MHVAPLNRDLAANSRLALTASLTRHWCQKLVQTDLLIQKNLPNKFLGSRVAGQLVLSRFHLSGFGVIRPSGPGGRTLNFSKARFLVPDCRPLVHNRQAAAK